MPSPTPMLDPLPPLPLLRLDEVAHRLEVSSDTIRRWVRHCTFPAPIRVTPRVLRWDAEDVDAWLAARRPTAHQGSSR